MLTEIQFIEGYKETSLPIIRLTKSRTGKVGTATFIFIEPKIFQFLIDSKNLLKQMTLFWENNKIRTNRIKVIFKQGKPFLIKAVFIFQKSSDWFTFLNFMTYYSKETGLSFSENNTSF
jgi:photosystem II protein